MIMLMSVAIQDEALSALRVGVIKCSCYESVACFQ